MAQNVENAIKKTYEKKHSFTHSQANDFLAKENYQLLTTTYVNANTPLEIKCPKGHIINMTLGNFRAGHRCVVCNGNKKHELDFVVNFFKQYGYELMSKNYIRANKYIEVRCSEGHIFTTKFSRFQQGHRCPRCFQYKGEVAISGVLEKNNIYFEFQKTFPDLLGLKNGNLSYDFYIPNKNILIEYQGEFHTGIPKYQTERQFQSQIEHDNRKREYAKKHNIKLIEIWHYDFENIENILLRELDIK